MAQSSIGGGLQRRISGLVLLGTCLMALSPAAAAFHPPWFCHGLDCPEYTVVDTFDDVQLRAYSNSKWASTQVLGVDYDAAVRTGFWRLFKYISGNNIESAKIPMTAPVKIRIIPSQGPFCEQNFTISFFVPPAFQDDTPAPSAPEVFVEEVPAFSVYVAEYPGFTNEKQVITQASLLLDKLQAHGASYSSDYYFSAGYDSPFRLIKRHNEVWVPAAANASSRPLSTR